MSFLQGERKESKNEEAAELCPSVEPRPCGGPLLEITRFEIYSGQEEWDVPLDKYTDMTTP